jgi:hypothetical protein
MYSHPHSTPQKLPMGNHKMEHCRTQVNTTSLRVLEAAVVETQRQPIGIEVI